MRSRWALLGLALAVPPAYAAFVYGYKLAEFLGFAVRLDQNLPLLAWAQVALTLAQMVVIGGALATCWQFSTLGRRRGAVVAMVVAWLAAAPLYVLLLFARPL